MYEKEKYKEIASCTISDIKELVLSENNDGNLVLAKRIYVVDDGETKMFFEKGSTIIKEQYKDNVVNFMEKVIKFLKK